ncbi:hypothetical protein NBRC110019_25340 [Neptunitalea chrysea]|uniref:Uncharacterized protein n=1 Tax=Neptunitalea chrysea TaxID=1647581 RepID=A0A9W6B6F3_9FLAO|nr:hypothetical protein NBRC110019_25340 [Neptunitalea chrysea]
MAGIERKKMFLPGEVSIATGWHSGEVSSGHSTRSKRGVIFYTGLTNEEGPNNNLFEMYLGAELVNGCPNPN